MPRPRRRSGSTQTRSPRARLGWLQTTLTNTTTAIGSQSYSDLFGMLSDSEQRDIGTTRRLLLDVRVRAQTAGSLTMGRFGVVSLTKDALASGIVPDPIGDPEADWLVNKYFSQEDASNVGVAFILDIRTGRRMAGELNLVFILETSVSAITAAIWNMGARILYMHK